MVGQKNESKVIHKFKCSQKKKESEKFYMTIHDKLPFFGKKFVKSSHFWSILAQF